jgi:hypothetical protein
LEGFLLTCDVESGHGSQGGGEGGVCDCTHEAAVVPLTGHFLQEDVGVTLQVDDRLGAFDAPGVGGRRPSALHLAVHACPFDALAKGQARPTAAAVLASQENPSRCLCNR